MNDTLQIPIPVAPIAEMLNKQLLTDLMLIRTEVTELRERVDKLKTKPLSYTVSELAAANDVSRHTVRRWVHQGLRKRHGRISAEEVTRFFNEEGKGKLK